MKLTDYICPICGEKFYTGGKRKCTHAVNDILKWQAAEIERLKQTILDVYKMIKSGWVATAEVILIDAIEESKHDHPHRVI